MSSAGTAIVFFLLVGALQGPASLAAGKPPGVFFFGDSVVDSGNNNALATPAKCNFPPYGRDFAGRLATGRFSNGRIPSDLIGGPERVCNPIHSYQRRCKSSIAHCQDQGLNTWTCIALCLISSCSLLSMCQPIIVLTKLEIPLSFPLFFLFLFSFVLLLLLFAMLPSLLLLLLWPGSNLGGWYRDAEQKGLWRPRGDVVAQDYWRLQYFAIAWLLSCVKMPQTFNGDYGFPGLAVPALSSFFPSPRSSLRDEPEVGSCPSHYRFIQMGESPRPPALFSLSSHLKPISFHALGLSLDLLLRTSDPRSCLQPKGAHGETHLDRGMESQRQICSEKKTILPVEDILALIGDKCDGVIGQLTEDWGEVLFSALRKAGGTAFSNMAVGYNNVDVNAANKHGIAVGNTPGVLTETTAELAASLSLAAARRIVEADQFMRAGLYEGWLPHLYVGNLLKGQTVGVIGAGRIGSANDPIESIHKLERFGYFGNVGDLSTWVQQEPHISYLLFSESYGQFLKDNGEQPVTWKRAATMEEVLRDADVEAVLVNASRGPVIDEAALVEHLKANPMFRVGLDVYEDEPFMKPGLAELKNAVVVPHIASASKWTREGMATLAALNVLGKIKGYPIWSDPNRVNPFLDESSLPPQACPSIVNAKQLELSSFLFLLFPPDSAPPFSCSSSFCYISFPLSFPFYMTC
ncbi:Glycerate dehydrogenase [Apostasia shenzhenica]|uniref:Glycerate dehydrogenase n=1 Tax=Apostasia shenzhenica TaxID=1088818 RepID=A0A2I0AX62_9ASPA|nr:Glycerate dehydrogenase [Apostasia shenzhenica]